MTVFNFELLALAAIDDSVWKVSVDCIVNFNQGAIEKLVSVFLVSFDIIDQTIIYKETWLELFHNCSTVF